MPSKGKQMDCIMAMSMIRVAMDIDKFKSHTYPDVWLSTLRHKTELPYQNIPRITQ